MKKEEQEKITLLASLSSLKKQEIDSLIKEKEFDEAVKEIYDVLVEDGAKRPKSLLKKYIKYCISDEDDLDKFANNLKKFSTRIGLELDMDKADYMIKNSEAVKKSVHNYIGSGVKFYSLTKLLSLPNMIATFVETYCDLNNISVIDDTVTDLSKMDGTSLYVQSIPKEILTKEQELELYKRYHNGDVSAKDEMIVHNLRLVVSIASKFAGRGYDKDDLIQAGNEGLMRAVEKFDATKGFKLSTYSTHWIRQYISREIDNNGRSIRIPVHVLEKIKMYNRICSDFINKHGIMPTDDEIMSKMNISEDELKRIKKYKDDAISLDTPVGEVEHGEVTTIGDFAEQTTFDDPEEHTMESIMVGKVDKMLGIDSDEINSSLTIREAEVLKLRFGFYNGISYTLEDVSYILKEALALNEKEYNMERIGILLPMILKKNKAEKTMDKLTRERIRQIETKALRKLERNREVKDLAKSMGINISSFISLYKK